MSYAAAIQALNAAHRFWRADVAAGSPVFGRYLVRGLFPPEQALPEPVRQQAGAMTKQRLTSLNRADVYYVHPQICDLLAEAAATLPDTTLVPEMVPSTHGWVWFVDPLLIHDPPAVQALHWQTIPRAEAPPTWRRDGLAISSYQPGAVPVFSNWAIWEYDDPIRGGIEANWPLHVLLSLWLFLQQQVLTGRPEPVANRAARRRIQAQNRAPEVQVIQLRRPAARGSAPDMPQSVDWSHRWLVRGHWRRQWLPSQGRHEPRWIQPYLKGPEDKPLKVRRRVFDVRR